MTTQVAGYIRMSTDKQQLSPKVQADKIAAWYRCQEEMGLLPDDAVFIGNFEDNAISSKVDMLMRPAGEHLITLLRPGDTIVVASLSRAFRSAGDAERTMEKMAEMGVRIVFLDINVDTSSPTGKMFLGILTVMTRFERDTIALRTREALATKIRRGEPIHAPGGWKVTEKDENGKRRLVPHHAERAVGTAILEMSDAGYNWNEIMSVIKNKVADDPLLKGIGCGRQATLRLAIAARLNWPRHNVAWIERRLPYVIDRVGWVKNGSHKQTLKDYKQMLIDEGIESHE